MSLRRALNASRQGKWNRAVVLACIAPAFLLLHCGGTVQCAGEGDPPAATAGRKASVYTVQVGAYSRPESAAEIVRRLRAAGADAYVAAVHGRIHKVRFGAFPNRKTAAGGAALLVSLGLIHEYLIVKTTAPRAPAIPEAESRLRDHIVAETERFIGLPYRWGCASPEEGFDCSGLTMAVYGLNGLILPRSSRAQWLNGTPVTRHQMKRGDLVFFRIDGSGGISHVGIYMGEGYFVHAPGRGKKIRIDSLSNSYFYSRFAGARTYL